jgi:hypothetical protein
MDRGFFSLNKIAQIKRINHQNFVLKFEKITLKKLKNRFILVEKTGKN